MPLPKPHKKEVKKDWLDRCMGEDVMNSEYPDNKQRYAICNSLWEDKEGDSMIPEIERRNIDLTEFRVSDDKKPKLTGYAAMFEKLSEPIFGFREKIAAGAFANSLKKDDIRALFNHDANYVLGRNKAKTLVLKEDGEGLRIEIDPPDTQWARDLQESIRRGDVSQMSFGFVVKKDEWEHIKNKESIRTLREVQLWDVSPVTFPAYPETSVKVRDYLNALKELDDADTLKGCVLSLDKLRLKYGYRQIKK